MTLRIMLVGLVASLGFELPSGPDVSRWSQAGAAWVRARVIDPSGPEVDSKLDLDGPSDCHQVRKDSERPALASERPATSDDAFKAVSDAMTADLSADLLTIHREETANPVGTEVAIEGPAPVVLTEGEEAGCLVVPAVEASPVEVASREEARPDDPAEPIAVPTERVDRVSSAVRLTREAIQAWTDLIQQPGEEGQPSR